MRIELRFPPKKSFDTKNHAASERKEVFFINEFQLNWVDETIQMKVFGSPAAHR